MSTETSFEPTRPEPGPTRSAAPPAGLPTGDNPAPALTASTPGLARVAAHLETARDAPLAEQVATLSEVHDALREALGALDGA